MFHLFDILLIELQEFLMIFYKPSFKKSDMMEYLKLKLASIQYHLSNLESMQAWTRLVGNPYHQIASRLHLCFIRQNQLMAVIELLQTNCHSHQQEYTPNVTCRSECDKSLGDVILVTIVDSVKSIKSSYGPLKMSSN